MYCILKCLYSQWNLFPRNKRIFCLSYKWKLKFNLHHWKNVPSNSMATLRNKKKLAAVSRETPESSRSGRAQSTLHPELSQDFISQVSEKIERRVTKKLSKEFSRTESRILGALSKFWQVSCEPTCSDLFRSRSGNIPDQQLRKPGNNWGSLLRRSLPRIEILYSSFWSSKQPGVEIYPHMVTGGLGEIRQYPHMVTATQEEEIPYCSPGTSSGKRKKARSTSQPQIRSENTPATIEADQILLALQQLATNSNSVNFNNNISRNSKLPKSLTTTMPTFDGKSEKLELCEDLLQTSLKIHNHLTEEDKINYFQSLMRGDALQTFKNITSPNRENLGEILTVFGRKYVNLQSMARAKHKFQRLVFNPANQKLIGGNPRNWRKTHSELPLKRSLNNSSMPNVSPPEEINYSGAFGEWHIWADCVASWKGVRTKWYGSPRWNADKYCDAASHTKKFWKAKTNLLTLQKVRSLSKSDSNEKKSQPEVTQIVPKIITKTMVVPKQTQTSSIKIQAITRRTIHIFKKTKDLGLSTHPVRPVVELTNPQRNVTLEQTQQTDRLHGVDDRKYKTKSHREMLKAAQMGMSKLQPKL